MPKKTDTEDSIETPSDSDNSDEEYTEDVDYTENHDDEGDNDISEDDDIDIIKSESLEIKKEDRVTRNKLTKYEMVRILGERQKQLTMGAKPLIKNHAGLPYDTIAEEELKLNMIPFKIKRPLPNGKYEIWTLDELDKEHLLTLLE